MASIGPVTLSITSSDSNNVIVSVSYTVIGSGHDLEVAQHYREVCRLVSEDSAPTGFIPDGTVHDTTTIFTEAEGSFIRSKQKLLHKSVLNEDSPGLDEIRAVVTLTPIPTSRESNRVQREFGGTFG